MSSTAWVIPPIGLFAVSCKNTENKVLAEYNKELLIEYECSYDEKKRKVQELSKPVLHKHKYTSKQLKLFELTSDMLKVEKIEVLKRKRIPQDAQKLHLFEVMNI